VRAVHFYTTVPILLLSVVEHERCRNEAELAPSLNVTSSAPPYAWYGYPGVLDRRCPRRHQSGSGIDGADEERNSHDLPRVRTGIYYFLRHPFGYIANRSKRFANVEPVFISTLSRSQLPTMIVGLSEFVSRQTCALVASPVDFSIVLHLCHCASNLTL
jgi:hypothetical protein